MLPYAPIDRRLVSDTVHERLRADILRGRYAAGDPLPSERTLSELFEVNRHAVREAVKRLQQSGLVQVAQGGATRVLDWRRTGGLELLADLGAHATGDVLRAVAEMRATVGADAARLCAERASGPRRERLRTHAAAHAAATSYTGRLDAYEALWGDIVDGSGNLAYRLAFNALVAARRGEGSIDPRVYAGEVDDPAAVTRMASAVAGGDPAAAERTARALLRRTVETAS